jgi:hypothetical protein
LDLNTDIQHGISRQRWRKYLLEDALLRATFSLDFFLDPLLVEDGSFAVGAAKASTYSIHPPV